MDAMPAQGQVSAIMPRQLKIIFLLLLVLVGTGQLSLWSDFPYFYHTDEPGKARQIIEGSRNLHHPPLMLESANLLVRALGRPLEPQVVTETGRLLSAIFCALAAALLTLTLAAFRPWPEAMLAGVLLLVQPDVQEYARFFKEDPALMFGWAAVFAAMASVEKRPGVSTGVALGSALAIAASAKYVGIFMVFPALWILFVAGRQAKASHAAITWKSLYVPAALAFLVLIAAINHRLWSDPSTFQASLGKEANLVLEGQGSVSKSIPHAGFFERLLNRAVHLLPFVAIGWWVAWKNRRELGWTPLLIVISPWALALLLAFSAKDSGRYFMPGSLGLATSAALGISWLCRLEKLAKFSVPLAAACALIVVGASITRCWDYFQGFQSDARKELLGWISDNLPPGSRVLQGRKVTLPDSSGRHADAWHIQVPRHIQIDTCKLVSSEANHPDELRDKGYTHVALAGDEYEVYIGDNKAKSSKAEEFARRRDFYEALFRNGRIIWERSSGKVGTHQPPLRLVEIPRRSP